MPNRRPDRPGPLAGRLQQFLDKEQWALEIGSLPTFRAIGLKLTRVLYLTARGFVVDRCSARASALTYITVLSIVPMLAFAFSLAKGFGADELLRREVIDPFLAQYSPEEPDEEPAPAAGEADGDEAPDAVAQDTSPALEPLAPGEPASTDAEFGPAAPDEGADAGQLLEQAVEKILGFVDATNVSSLGIFGLVILVFTVLKLLGSIEQAFNDIWGIPRSRPFLRKLSDYLSITITVPILLLVATGLKSSDVWVFLRDTLHLGPLVQLALELGSQAAIWIGFTLMYLFLPNTRVSWRAALAGGVVGGSLWQIAQVLYVKFQVGVANYNAIYAGFAALPVLLFWIYVSWITVLLGAELAYAYTHEHSYRQVMRDRALDHAARERLALRVCVAAARAFHRAEAAPTVAGLAEHLGVPERAVEGVLEALVQRGILALVGEEGPERQVLPARDLELVHVEDVLDALAGEGTALLQRTEEEVGALVEATFEQRKSELAGAAYNRTLRELAEDLDEARSTAAGSAASRRTVDMPTG